MRFKRNADDYLYIRAGLDLPADFNPSVSEFFVEVRSGGDLVYSGTLEAGVVPKRGHRWRYLDRDARKGSGAPQSGKALAPGNSGIGQASAIVLSLGRFSTTLPPIARNPVRWP